MGRTDEKIWRKLMPAAKGEHGERLRFEEGALVGRAMTMLDQRDVDLLAEDRLGRLTGAAFRRELATCTLEPHRLKTHPKQFEAVRDGSKRFEVRSTEDRQFWTGDLLLLEEWNPDDEEYTGRWHIARVTYMLTGGNYGLPHETAVLSITDAEPCIGDVFTLAYPDSEGRRFTQREHTIHIVESVDVASPYPQVKVAEYIRAPWGPTWMPPRELARKVARRA